MGEYPICEHFDLLDKRLLLPRCPLSEKGHSLERGRRGVGNTFQGFDIPVKLVLSKIQDGIRDGLHGKLSLGISGVGSYEADELEPVPERPIMRKEVHEGLRGFRIDSCHFHDHDVEEVPFTFPPTEEPGVEHNEENIR